MAKTIRSILVTPRRGGRRVWWAVLVPVIVAACWPARGYIRASDIRPLPSPTANADTIRGLQKALDRAGDNPVRVLVLHGMREDEANYSAPMQRRLAADRLRLVPADTAPAIPLERGYEVRLFAGAQALDPFALPQSELRRRAWLDPVTKAERVVFYEMLWAPTRDAVKDRLLACFESGLDPARCASTTARRNQDGRGWANGALKDDILVDGFGDATLVLGPTGHVLRDDVDLALCTVITDVAAGPREMGLAPLTSNRCESADSDAQNFVGAQRLEQAQVFVITHSLGSFLVMDAHQRYALAAARAQDEATLRAPCDMESEEAARAMVAGEVGGARAAARASTLERLLDEATVFMRANQVSLLSLARIQARCSADGKACPNPALAVSGCGIPHSPVKRGASQYVAFNDAADLLGFELPPYLGGVAPFGTLVNVSVRNPYFGIPGLIRNPADVHNRSDENPAVLNAIVDGITLPTARAR